MIILTKRPRARYVSRAGGYKLHAKMLTYVYSSYVSRNVFSGVLQSCNLM